MFYYIVHHHAQIYIYYINSYIYIYYPLLKFIYFPIRLYVQINSVNNKLFNFLIYYKYIIQFRKKRKRNDINNITNSIIKINYFLLKVRVMFVDNLLFILTLIFSIYCDILSEIFVSNNYVL